MNVQTLTTWVMYIVNLSVLAHVWRTAYAPLASRYEACVSASACGILSLFLGIWWRADFVILHCLAAFIWIYWTTERLNLVFTSKKSFSSYYLCVLRSFYGVLRFSGIPGVLYGLRNAEIWEGVFCRISPAEHSANYTLEFFRIPYSGLFHFPRRTLSDT